MIDSALSIKNASGKTFSLLNDTSSSQPSENNKLTTPTSATTPKRKYHCNEPGCNKSFTTSGHLARHHRIHTGEKNFHCLHPGCPSRFSRQDNMMQHYRTHLSQKVRRQQARHSNKQQKKEASPELYRHSYYGPEDRLSFQPLVVTRPRRSATMPSSTTIPYYPMMNRPRRRALSTSSSTSDSSSSSFTLSPSHAYYSDDYCYQKQVPIILPPLPLNTMVQQEDWNNHKKQQQQQQQQQPQQYFSNLLHLANIVSTFG